MELTIEKPAYLGNFLSIRNDGKIIFIPYVLTDERVKCKIIKEKNDFAQAIPIKILKPSDKRIESECRYFGRCGGCSYLHTTYKNEIFIKKTLLNESLSSLYKEKTADFISSSHRFYYRNSARFHRDKTGNIGFMIKDTNRIIDIDDCILLEKPILKKYHKIKKQIKNIGEIVIKSGISIKNGEPNAFDKKSSTFYIEIAGKRYFSSLNIFFQNNTYIIPKWLEYIARFINDDMIIVELYSGIGLISQGINKKIYGIGIESSKEATRLSIKNREMFSDKLKKFEYICDEAKNFIKILKKKKIDVQDIDLILLNPPRKGIDKNTINKIIKSNVKKLVYSSCNIIAFKRDAKVLVDKGYRVSSVMGFDFFPGTYHFETVAFFEK